MGCPNRPRRGEKSASAAAVFARPRGLRVLRLPLLLLPGKNFFPFLLGKLAFDSSSFCCFFPEEEEAGGGGGRLSAALALAFFHHSLLLLHGQTLFFGLTLNEGGGGTKAGAGVGIEDKRRF